MNCLVTGSTGFLGKHLIPVLQEQVNVTTVSLRKTEVSEIGLEQIDAIIHLAGLAHQMQKVDSQRYFEVNKHLTLELAEEAKKKGVAHFVFISTVKVFGDHAQSLYNENSECFPTDPYGQSKLEAERGLALLEDENFTVSIIRPPLIYGSGVKGNLQRIIGLCQKLPILPFGKIENKRSMVYVGNLIALIIEIINQKKSGVFIAGDKKLNSTSDLVNMIIRKLDLEKSNISIPVIVRLLLKLIKPAIYHRLFSDFIVDNTITNNDLGFDPPYSFEEGIGDMVKPYIN